MILHIQQYALCTHKVYGLYCESSIHSTEVIRTSLNASTSQCEQTIYCLHVLIASYQLTSFLFVTLITEGKVCTIWLFCILSNIKISDLENVDPTSDSPDSRHVQADGAETSMCVNMW